MEKLLQDLRYGFRSLRKAPGFTLMAVLVVTLGIGANTAIFSVVNAVLLQQLPFRDPQQLVSISAKRTDNNQQPISIADFQDFQSQSRLVAPMAAYAFWSANVTGQGEPERLQEVRTTGNFFEVTGTPAFVGRTLVPADDDPGSAHVAVLTYGLWQRRFGGDRALVGKKLEINGDSYTVVGVLPPAFFFPGRGAEMAVPLVPQADPRRTDRSDHFLSAIGRLKPGVSPSQAAAELNAIAQHLQQQYPKTNAKSIGVTLVSLYDQVVGKFRSALLMLLGAVGLLLLIACSSLANLLLARASARSREIAIRTALGADRWRVVRQLVTETVILAMVGGLAGILLAAWGVRGLVALSPADLPRAGEIAVDGRVLWFAAGLLLLSGLVFGILPALQSSKSGFENLRASGALAEGSGRGSRARGMIVAAQVALSLVLLVGAGLLLKSFARLQAVRPGFDADHVLAMRISLPPSAFPNTDALSNFYTELQGRLETLPGVTSAGAVSILPLSGPLGSVDFTVVGQPPSSPDHVPSADWRATGPGYLKTMAITLMQGRDFAQSDNASAVKVAWVNQTLAHRYFEHSNPIGQHLRVEDRDEMEIVGVVSNVRQNSLDEDVQPAIYVPYAQTTPFALVYLRNNMFWVVRTAGDPLAISSAVRHQLREVQKDAPIAKLGAMEDYLAASAAPRRFNLLLVGMFGLTAMLLAVLGVYGVISYSVTQRTREFGVRLALGARQRDVLGVVIAQAGRLVGVGIAIGLIGAAFSTRLLADLLFQVRPGDSTTFLAVVGMVALVALIACLVPARRAAKVDPMVALRYE